MTGAVEPADIRVVSGEPNDEELAAVIAVLSAAAAQAAVSPRTMPPSSASRWEADRRSVRAWSGRERWI